MSDVFAFTPEERAVFQYHDGDKEVFADPLAISRQKRFVMPNVDQLIRAINSGTSVMDFVADERRREPATERELTIEEMNTIRAGEVAHEKLVNGIRVVFGLAEFDPATGKGSTAAMAIKVWNHYQDWVEKKSGSTPTEPTSSPPTPGQSQAS